MKEGISWYMYLLFRKENMCEGKQHVVCCQALVTTVNRLPSFFDFSHIVLYRSSANFHKISNHHIVVNCVSTCPTLAHLDIIKLRSLYSWPQACHGHGRRRWRLPGVTGVGNWNLARDNKNSQNMQNLQHRVHQLKPHVLQQSVQTPPW
jgi:hypothetical protein